MEYRDLTRGDILNISREFNLVHKLESLQYSYNEDDANKSDLVKTWLRLIGGDGFAMNDLTLTDLTLLDEITGEQIRAYIESLTLIEETPPITPTIAQIPFQAGNPTFTLHEPLDKSTPVVFWGVKEGYKTQNLGRAIHVDEAVKYPVNISGVGQYDTLEIRVNHSQANFTVEY